MADTALVVMARYPEEGKTKTRLARTIGDTHAVALYAAFLSDLAHHLARLPYCDLHWTYTPANVDFAAFVRELVPTYAPYIQSFAQQGPDLGARLHYAFQWAHAHGFARSIIIGSDSPQITPDIVARARAALDDADVVLGPAEDGGYYLIAMRQPHDVFSGIPMSTPDVLQMTIEAAQRQQLSVRLIDTLFDVDEVADLQHLARLLAADSTRAPATAAYLASLRMFS
jgi:rSAM/selenodomain-associated transferase 1